MPCLSLFSTSGLKWNFSKDCVWEVNLLIFSFIPNKIEIKMEILSSHQLKITDFSNIPLANVKNLVPNVFNKEKYVLHYKNFQLYLRLESKLKIIHCVLEFNQLQWIKPHVAINTKISRNRRNGDKGGKALYKLMNNAVFGETMENLRN